MSSTARREGSFLGHPTGLAVLCFSSVWERFAWAGMQTLLVLYATHWLFQPANIGKIWGFAAFRGLLENAYGPLSTTGLASAVFGVYAGLIFLAPLAGGLIADRLLGKTRTIVIGALMLMAGHILMGFEQSFLIALALIIAGVGFFKTNVTGQIGDLYAAGDVRRARAFQILVLCISVASTLSPLICGTLGEKVGWHWGFGAAGAGMVIGLLTYLLGRRFLPADAAAPRRRGAVTAPRPKLEPGEGRTLLILVLLLPVLALAAVGNQQIFNAYLLWGETHYSLIFFGRAMPVSWLVSITSILAIASVAGSIAFWRWWGLHWREPDEITKLTIGALICASAPLMLALASMSGNGKVSLGWGLAFHTLNEVGFANLYPVGLALYSRCAPRAIGGTMIAVYYLHMFMANMAVGWLGGLLPTMPGASFWLLHAGLIAGAAVILLVVRSAAGRLLAPTTPG